MKLYYIISLIICFSIILGSVGTILSTYQNNQFQQQTILPVNSIRSTTASIPVSSWPMFWHDPQHTGFIESDGPDSNTIFWMNDAFGAASPPIIHNEKIYVSQGGHYNIYVLNAFTGTTVGFFPASTQSAVAVTDTSILVVTDSGISCYSINDYSEQWFVPLEIGSALQGKYAPIVVGASVYQAYPSLPGNLTITSIDTTTGTIQWTTMLDAFSNTDIALDNGNIYITTEKQLFCCDATTGNIVWNTTIIMGTTDNFNRVTPTITQNKLFTLSTQGTIYCLDLNNKGSIMWQYATGETAAFGKNSISTGYGNIYVGTSKKLYCLDITNPNPPLWTYASNDKPMFYPLLADEKVYVTCKTEGLKCLNAHNGDFIWSFDASSDYPPALAYGTLYYIASGSVPVLYAFHENQAPEPPLLTGTTQGQKNVAYIFSAVSSDPEQHSISYQFDYGDGTISPWSSFVSSGTAISLQHQWTASGSCMLKAKAKDSQQKESSWSEPVSITITEEQADVLHLSITPVPIPEKTEFTVQVTLHDTPLEDIAVSFLNTIKKTDTTGVVTFTAPSVTRDTSYPLTAYSQTYIPITTTITVLNTPEQTTGFIYGIVSDPFGTLLSDVQITAISSLEKKSTTSDSDGRYVFSLPVGTYTLVASKTGYITATISLLVVKKQYATEANINLQSQQTSVPVSSENTVIEYTIENEIQNGKIGARMDVTTIDETPAISYYSDMFMINTLSSTKDQVSFSVNADDGTQGTIFVIRIAKDTLQDITTLMLTYDDQILEESKNADSFFTADMNIPSWLSYTTSTDAYVLVKVPHFSEHTITISSVIEAIGGITAVIFYVLIAGTVGILFCTSVLTSFSRLKRSFDKKINKE